MFSFFFFNDTATTEIYTLSLHDALPISGRRGRSRPHGHRGEGLRPAEGAYRALSRRRVRGGLPPQGEGRGGAHRREDRKSTRLNSSHLVISYAVFCLKKKLDSIAVRRLS